MANIQSDYFLQRNQKTNIKIREILATLPYFCHEFFRGIENKTTHLTRLNYAQDLKIFFNFLTTEILEFNDFSIKDLKIEDLNMLTSTHMEIFLDYLSGYYIDDNFYSNNEKGKARKLSAVKSLLKYFYKKDKLKANVSTKIESPKIHEKEIIRLEVDEVVKLLDQTENPKNFTKRHNTWHVHLEKKNNLVYHIKVTTIERRVS